MSKHTLLVVDDSPGVRYLVGVTLGTTDFDILYASDGDEAIDVAQQQHPDLVLLDVMMPKRSGLDVCRQLKSDPATADIKVIMITARDQPSHRAEGLRAGADVYLTKPFSPLELLNTVHRLSGS